MYAKTSGWQEENEVDRIAYDLEWQNRHSNKDKQERVIHNNQEDTTRKEERAMEETFSGNEPPTMMTEEHKQEYKIGEIRRIDIDRIFPPEKPIREYVAAEHLDDLAEDMRERGQMQNIGVTPEGEIVFGLRRYLAAQKAGLTALECIICNSGDKHAAAMFENILRRNLTAIELAEGVAKLNEEKGVSQGRLGKIIDKGRTDVNVLLQIAKMPKYMRDAFRKVPQLRQDKLKKLARLHEKPEEQEAYFKQLVSELDTPKPKKAAQDGDSGKTPDTAKNKVIFATEKACKIRLYLDKLLPRDGKPLLSRDKKMMEANGKVLYDELEALALKIASILTYCNINLSLQTQELPTDTRTDEPSPEPEQNGTGALGTPEPSKPGEAFQPPVQPLMLPAGDTSPIQNDTVDEDNETFVPPLEEDDLPEEDYEARLTLMDEEFAELLSE